MGEIRDNLAPLSGMVALAVGFLAVYGATTSFVAAAIVAVLLAVGVFLIFRQLFPANADLREYNLDARRRVKKVLASVDQISQMARHVSDSQAANSLMGGCKIVPQLLNQTAKQETTTFKLASTAANVQSYVTSVQSVLEVYLRIQKDPTYFQNASQQLALGRQGFADFETFCLKSIQQLNAGDTAGYAANLETLQPLTLPEISGPLPGPPPPASSSTSSAVK
jgi:hypothetical protein